MYLFYTPDYEPNMVGQTMLLSEEESGHAVRVLRFGMGDRVHTTNGRGAKFLCHITNPHPKHCELVIDEAHHEPSAHPFYLHLAVAPTKNIDRIEWMIEKTTEIGMDEFTPLNCHFSERKVLRTDRLEKITLSAMKQSLSAYLPKVNPLTDCSAFIRSMAEHKDTTDLYIAHCYEEDKHELKELLTKGRDIVVLIGPEGDFSKEEIDLALSLGFRPVSLGNTRLRTETAGLVACHTAVLLA